MKSCIAFSYQFFLWQHIWTKLWLNEALGVKKKKREMIIVHKLLKAFSFLFAIFFSICASKKQNDKSYIVKYLSYWLNGLPPNYLLLIFAMGLFDWLITQKKTENWEAPQNKRLLCEDGECCLWLNYIGEKGRASGKEYRIKWGHTRNTLGDHIGNLGNIIGNLWE